MVTSAQENVTGAAHEADPDVGDAATPSWHPASFDAVLTRHVVWALADLVIRRRAQAEVVELCDAAFWGGAISDERFVVVTLR